MIFRPGLRIVRNKYVIVDLLGKGGFGEVYKAMDTQLEREVAVKVIQRNVAGSTADEFLDYEARFKLEARIGAQIRDDNVIAVLGLEQHGRDTVVLVSEYASGGSLSTRIAAGALDANTVIDLGVQICKGLAAIHRPPLNGVHRDIKPSNILFDSLGRPKVADLGLVQIYGMSGARSQGMGGAQPGTPGYMSPEQETETGYLTPASDIYSLGCVLFEALTQKVYQHQPRGTKAHDLNPVVPAELDAVIAKALSVDPGQRYQDADGMRQGLEGCRVAMTRVQEDQRESSAFVFRNGARAQTPEEWARIADRSRETWADAAHGLGLGTAPAGLETWLQKINQPDLAAQVSDIRRKQTDMDVALDQVLNLILSDLPPPVLGIDKTDLDFGALERGDRPTQKLAITNRSRGLLTGRIEAQAPWLRVSRTQIKCRAGETQTVDVTLDSAAAGEGPAAADPAIEIQSNGGATALAARTTITWSPVLALSTSALNFGEYVEGGVSELRQETLTVRNSGGGLLRGEGVSDADWLAVSPSTFELTSGQEATIQVTADPALLSEPGTHRAEIRVAAGETTRAVPVRISRTLAGFESATRWRHWAIYAGLLIVGLAGWAAPLGFSLAWLCAVVVAPPIWQIALFAVLPIIAAALLIVVAPRFAASLDRIENFYHRGSLTEEIPGRLIRLLPRLIFGAVIAGGAVLLVLLQQLPPIGLVKLAQLPWSNPALPRWPVALVAGFLFGFLILNARPAGQEFKRGDRWLAPLRGLLLAVVTVMLYRALWASAIRLENMILAAALGLALAADNLPGLTLRVQWVLARLRPIVPAAVLMALFYEWAKLGLFFPSVGPRSFMDFFIQPGPLPVLYAWHPHVTPAIYAAWRDLLFCGGIIVLAVLGFWLDRARNASPRANLPAFAAALLLTIIPAMLGFLVFTVLVQVLALKIGLGIGLIGIALTIGPALVALWALSGSKQGLRRISEALGKIAAAIRARIPALAGRTGDIVTQTVARAGLSEYVSDASRATSQLRSNLSFRTGRSSVDWDRTLDRIGLGDYLSGATPISPTARLMALLTLLFAAPGLYLLITRLIATILRVGFTVVIWAIVLVVIGGGAYILWKRSRQGK